MAKRRKTHEAPAGGRGAITGSVRAFARQGIPVKLLGSFLAEERGRVSRALGKCGQQHATHFNRRHGRSGTLWQERFWSCLVDSQGYAMQVMRYIELNPVRAGLAVQPESYLWTSAHHHLGLARDSSLAPLTAFQALGSDEPERHAAYRKWLEAGIPAHELKQIRLYSRQQRALGGSGFQEMVERAFGRNATIRRPGRPNVGSGL